MTGLQMAFTAVLCFGLSPALLATGVKMPPAGHRRPHKRRNVRGEYGDTAAHAVRPGGQKKARPGVGRVVVLCQYLNYNGVMYDDFSGILSIVPRVSSNDGYIIAIIVTVSLRLSDGVPTHYRHAG